MPTCIEYGCRVSGAKLVPVPGQKKSAKDKDYVEYITKKNVFHSLHVIRARSPILKEMSDKGEIKIIGAYHDLNTVEVVYL